MCSIAVFRSWSGIITRSLIRMETKDILRRLESRAAQADGMIELLDRQISEMKRVTAADKQRNEVNRLRKENANLRAEIDVWKKRLIDAESKNGVKQIAVPQRNGVEVTQGAAKKTVEVTVKEAKDDAKKTDVKEKKVTEKKMKEKKPAEKKSTDEAAPLDVSRLDLRIGKILTAARHPNADALYVEEIDVGEEKPRTVVSGLVKHVPIEEMQNRLVMVLCNLKPANMRGVQSQAMVMCASSLDKVEILAPPQGAVPGDRVMCDEFPGQPDRELNPKKKIFEQIAPDLKTDDQLRATYKGKWLVVAGKGNVTAPSLPNVQIK